MNTAEKIRSVCKNLKRIICEREDALINFKPVVSNKNVSKVAIIKILIDLVLAEKTSEDKAERAYKLLLLCIMLRTQVTENTLTPEALYKIIDAVENLLIEKNKSYGDSALNPIRIFADAPPERLIEVRIDDKLSRIVNCPTAFDEDVVLDLIGYLILYRIALLGNEL